MASTSYSSHVEMELLRREEAVVSHLLLMQAVRGKKEKTDRGRMKESQRAANSFGGGVFAC